MITPTLVIDGKKYQAKAPTFGLWRKIAKLNTEKQVRVKELMQLRKQAKELLDNKEIDKVEQVIANLEEKSMLHQQQNIEGMVNIIKAAFDLQDVDIENSLLLEDLVKSFNTLDYWINLIASEKFSQIPNGETPAE